MRQIYVETCGSAWTAQHILNFYDSKLQCLNEADGVRIVPCQNGVASYGWAARLPMPLPSAASSGVYLRVLSTSAAQTGHVRLRFSSKFAITQSACELADELVIGDAFRFYDLYSNGGRSQVQDCLAWHPMQLVELRPSYFRWHTFIGTGEIIFPMMDRFHPMLVEDDAPFHVFEGSTCGQLECLSVGFGYDIVTRQNQQYFAAVGSDVGSSYSLQFLASQSSDVISVKNLQGNYDQDLAILVLGSRTFSLASPPMSTRPSLAQAHLGRGIRLRLLFQHPCWCRCSVYTLLYCIRSSWKSTCY